MGKNDVIHKSRARGLDRLRVIRRVIVGIRRFYLRRFWGMDIHPTVEMSLSAKFDRTFPIGIHIGEKTYVAFEVRILTHDMTRGIQLHTRIGKNCFIGGRSLIMPGVEIGDSSIVGAGSIVTKSVLPRTIVAGNPARVLRSNIDVGPYGRLVGADETEAELAKLGLD